MAQNIIPRSENYSQWYLDVISNADLVDNSPVRGCMIFKPYGYALWEEIKGYLDKRIKETGHQNVYFPMLIPKSFLSKEAKHVEGFAKECAVVTHYRLKYEKGEAMPDPDAKLEEEYVIRPTSETIMYDTFSKWIRSWRDLPLLVNQWANVMRWEMRTRPFLRTCEILWQEGHTAHMTLEEAENETIKMLNVYKELTEDIMAMSSIFGVKPEHEKFAGALHTYTFETITQDAKALQSGTSHNLGQNFAKVFDVKYASKEGKDEYVWQTSWGVSTRLIGALIMSHSDDRGLVLPPKIAPIKVVIVPILKKGEEEKIISYGLEIKEKLKTIGEVKFDDRENLSPGMKFNEWEKKGIPIRIEYGLKDMENNQVTLVRRDKEDKEAINVKDIFGKVSIELVNMQKDLKTKADKFMKENTYYLDDYNEFKNTVEVKNGFFMLHWCEDIKCAENIDEELKTTIRCLPFEHKEENGKCIRCGNKSKRRWLFAKNY